ncbi:MAG: hypothetical protein ABSG78_08135 [Verrucomicrobiota bacterium]|jgi:hypothetical protein
MPHSETIQKSALQGPLSLAHLLILGLALAAILAWLAWRWARDSGSWKKSAFLLLLRLGALALALWMLAGASTVTLRRDTRAKSVVFMVDSSASMGLVDPVDGSGETVRWTGSETKLRASPPVAALDEVIGSLQSARSDVARLRLLTEGGDPNQHGQILWEQIHHSVDSAAAALGPLLSPVSRADAAAGAELDRVAAFLKDNAAPMGLWKKTGGKSPEDRLDETAAFITAAIQRIERQSHKLAAAYEKNAAGQDKPGLALQSKMSRNDKVASWLDAAENSWLKDVADHAGIERYTFASDVLSLASNDWRQVLRTNNNPAANSTDLAAALNFVAQEAAKQSIDAVVMITDGGHNAPADPRQGAAALRDVPLFIVPIGAVEMPRDAILHHVHAPRAVFKNDTAVIDAMVTAYSCEGEQLQVELSSDGVTVEKHIIDVTTRMYDGRVSFQWKGLTPGRHTLLVKILPVPRELTLDNNQVQVEVEVMEDVIKVLVADDLPRWEFRYVVNLFKRDKHVAFEQLLFEPADDAPTQVIHLVPSFPRDMAGWRKYRVVILGDVSPAQLSPAQQEMLRQYVAEDGGNLIVIAGQTAMPAAFADQPLAAMIPATASGLPANPTQPFSLVVTAEGSSSVPTQLDDDPLASERIWREMSAKLPIYNLSPVSKPKPTAHVLIAATTPRLSGQEQAFLSWQYIGLGRVIYLAAPVTWQLRYQNGDLYHHRFWGQLLRWAIAREMSTGSKTVRLLTDKTTYTKGDTAQIGLRLAQVDGQAVAGAQCNVEARQDGRLIAVIPLHEEPGSPGAYRGTLDNLSLGPVTLRAGGTIVATLLAAEGHPEPVEQIIAVDPAVSSELNNPLCNLPLLGEIADVSGGSLTPPASLKNALAHLNTVPDVMETIVSREALWDRWLYLWLFIAFVAAEWLLRKFWRMV